jgi:hypothetical protein
MADEKKYKRLSGRGNSFRMSGTAFGRYSLWLGEDHILQVCSYGYSEEYRRFYFRDIQAVVLRQTAFWWIAAIIGGLFTIFAIWIWSHNDTIAKVWGSILGIPFACLFLLNLIFGPTCECRLLTAVQAEPLPSLSRMRSARKTINAILPRIQEAQGAFQPPPPPPPGSPP